MKLALNPVSIMADRLGEHLSSRYLRNFPEQHADYAAFLGDTAREVIGRIGNSDALYHNAEHTMMVVLAGQQILLGRLLSEDVSPEDWLHFMIALLVHDIGFVRGICSGDDDDTLVADAAGNTVTPRRGASDACLAPYHIERGKIYVRERFAQVKHIDPERIAATIEMTRFPVPEGQAHKDVRSEAGLVRAADLIGQLADPFYHRKINALYWELRETGVAEAMGYRDAADVADKFPKFYEAKVAPYIGPALRHLERTAEGKDWIASLKANVFRNGSRGCHIGPYPGTP